MSPLQQHPIWRSPAIAPTILLLLVALVYWPGLSGDFLFDDFPNIITNQKVHMTSVDATSLERAAAGYEPGQIGRPLATLSFAFNWYLHGKDPWGYKLVGLCVHLLNALLVFLLARRILALPSVAGPKPWSRWAPLAIALFWAVHPLQVSSVLYIVQRMETLSLTFVLLGLLAYLRGRLRQMQGEGGWHWLVAAVVLSLLGLLSKETAILFPAYFLALELSVLGFSSSSPATTRALRGLYGIGVLLALLLFVFVVFPHYTAPGYFDGRHFAWDERLLTQLRVLVLYLGQIVLPLPTGMTFYYDDYVVSSGWLSPPTTLLCGIALLALLASAFALRKRMPLYALGIFWFFASHILSSNVIPLELVFEHRNYFALFGIGLALADLLHRLPLPETVLKSLVTGIVVLAFGLLATIRAATWGDPFTLALDLAQRNPQSARASSDLATLYVALSESKPGSPFFGFAVAELERASRLPSASALPEQGLILMHATTGLPVKDEWWQQLIHKTETRPLSPQDVMAVTGLLKQRYEGVEMDDRRLNDALQALLARGGSQAYQYAQAGDFALKFLADEDLADAMFVKAIERNPTDKEYAQRIITALRNDGAVRQADAVTAKAIELGLVEAAQSRDDSGE